MTRLILLLALCLPLFAESVLVRIYDGGVREFDYSYRGADGKLIQGKRWVRTVWYDTIGAPDRSFVLVTVKPPVECPPHMRETSMGNRREYALAIKEALPKIAHDIQCEISEAIVEYADLDGTKQWAKWSTLEELTREAVPVCQK